MTRLVNFDSNIRAEIRCRKAIAVPDMHFFFIKHKFSSLKYENSCLFQLQASHKIMPTPFGARIIYLPQAGDTTQAPASAATPGRGEVE
jgi:hypothetical protein